MKLNYLIFCILLAFCSALLAATNNFDPATSPLPTDVSSYWTYAISFITPLIIWIVRKAAPNIPTLLLPTITPFVGIGLGLLLNYLTKANLSWVDMAKAGALAVFIREVVNQAITKRLEPQPPTTTTG